MIGTAAEGERGDFLQVAQLDDCEVCYCREIEEREGGREGGREVSFLIPQRDIAQPLLGRRRFGFGEILKFKTYMLLPQKVRHIGPFRHRRPKYKHTKANLPSNRTQGGKRSQLQQIRDSKD